ncbi:MAG: cytochrome c [Zetaproteobacteria bacterium]|nr:cytochrome c [Zetaproteobacteria bacterium]
MANDTDAGATLFKKNCSMCHAVDKKKTGPALKDMSQDPARLTDVITNGSKPPMKAFSKKFSAEEIDTLVAYIRSEQK